MLTFHLMLHRKKCCGHDSAFILIGSLSDLQTINKERHKKVTRKVQGEPQSEAQPTLNTKRKRKRTNMNACKINKQMHEKHKVSVSDLIVISLPDWTIDLRGTCLLLLKKPQLMHCAFIFNHLLRTGTDIFLAGYEL